MNHDIHPASERGTLPLSPQVSRLRTEADESESSANRTDKQNRTADDRNAPQYDSFMRIIRR